QAGAREFVDRLVRHLAFAFETLGALLQRRDQRVGARNDLLRRWMALERNDVVHAVLYQFGTALAMVRGMSTNERIERGTHGATLVRADATGEAGVLLLPTVYGVERSALDWA